MTSETLREDPAHPAPPLEKDSANGSWIVAVLFWATILIAAGLYAAVALSPKLYGYFNLRNEHYQTQVELVTLERRVMHLKRVMHAFETDPEFAAEQARVELGVGRPGDERIAVDSRLQFAPDPDFDPSVFRKSILPWYTPLLDVFTHNRKTRRGLLIASVSLMMLAFTFFQESQSSQIMACARSVKNGCLRATARYRQPQSPSPHEKAAIPESLPRHE